MPHPLYIAFIWHQHQPLYKTRRNADSLSSNHYRLPWVRLHGTKDYLDLVLLLERYPKLHQTVNLVPSLILQLEDYAAGTAFDPYLEVNLTPTEQLGRGQRQFIIERFFDANYQTLIAPHRRYAQLYEQRQERGQVWCQENWQLQDYGDLLAWHNLAWIDPLFWDDPEIAVWLKQGQDFTLSDRQRIYSKQRQIISQIIPQHRKMQAQGQLEVTTTPYTHPILPLLADTNAGRVAVPNMTLPTQRFQWAPDIPRHLRKAWDLYQDRFQQEPRGLWPSEQSVSPQVLTDIVNQGFQWICSDEAVLGSTLKHFFHRDQSGNILEPELLYQPYRLTTPVGDLAIVFRDHRLSDLIGFTYSSMAPAQAAADLVGQLEAIAANLKQRQTSGSTTLEQPWLVNIALDGENCWEYYQQDGKPFLENLYQTLSDRPELKLVTVSEFLDRFPATATIPAGQLHSGSWVDGSFTTWIGDPAKNRAWELLAEARAVLAQHPEATEESNPAAWEALYAAEGSDWFWWFGAGHSSSQDAIFDQLFREHLYDIYQALNEPIPANLRQPVEHKDSRSHHRPQGFIYPTINGQGEEQGWAKAARLEVGGARGTMHQSNPVQRLWYGINQQNFYLRLDFQSGIQPDEVIEQLYLLWFYPNLSLHNSPILLQDLPDAPPVNYLFHYQLEMNLLMKSIRLQEARENHQWHSRASHASMALARCLEVEVPWADLQVPREYPLRLILVTASSGRFTSYLPENGLISIET